MEGAEIKKFLSEFKDKSSRDKMDKILKQMFIQLNLNRRVLVEFLAGRSSVTISELLEFFKSHNIFNDQPHESQIGDDVDKKEKASRDLKDVSSTVKRPKLVPIPIAVGSSSGRSLEYIPPPKLYVDSEDELNRLALEEIDKSLEQVPHDSSDPDDNRLQRRNELMEIIQMKQKEKLGKKKSFGGKEKTSRPKLKPRSRNILKHQNKKITNGTKNVGKLAPVPIVRRNPIRKSTILSLARNYKPKKIQLQPRKIIP